MAALLSEFASRIINAYVAAGNPENISDFITEFMGTPAPAPKKAKLAIGPTCCAITSKGTKCIKAVKNGNTLCAIHIKKANGDPAPTECSTTVDPTAAGDVVITSRRAALLEEFKSC
jgi:hypothetical protein